MVPREIWERCIMVESETSAGLRKLMSMGFGGATVLTGATALAQEIKAGEPLEAAVSSAWDVITRLHALDVARVRPQTPLEKAYDEMREEVVEKLREQMWERRHRRIRPPQSRPRFAGRYAVRFPAWIQAHRDRPLVEND